MEFMTDLLTTWGKTWHTWPDPTTPVPLGEPLLMWSLTGDGQADKEMVAERDKEFGGVHGKVAGRAVEAIGYEVPQVPAAGVALQRSAGNGQRPARTGRRRGTDPFSCLREGAWRRTRRLVRRRAVGASFSAR